MHEHRACPHIAGRRWLQAARARRKASPARRFRVDAAQLFAAIYPRAILVEYHQTKGVIVTKGGGNQESKNLYLDGSFELEPDFCIRIEASSA